MKGIVVQHLNERESPDVNARILGFYKPGDIIDIEEPADGDLYDGEDSWHKLAKGTYVWSGAVETEAGCEQLSNEDKMQWLISYRRLDKNRRPDLAEDRPADRLSYTEVRLPASACSVQMTEIETTNADDIDAFVKKVVNSVKGLKDAASRKHVLIYIPGYQFFGSLKLGLFNHFVQNYMDTKASKIAKVLFLVWPSNDLSRKDIDDRSIAAGRDFTKKDLFRIF